MSEQPMRWGDHPETRAAMDGAIRRAASAPDPQPADTRELRQEYERLAEAVDGTVPGSAARAALDAFVEARIADSERLDRVWVARALHEDWRRAHGFTEEWRWGVLGADIVADLLSRADHVIAALSSEGDAHQEGA